MNKNLILSTIVILFSLLLPINENIAFAAYELDSVSIRHQVYEDGRKINRLAFDMKDDSDNYIDRKNIVTSVILKYPPPNNNIKVNLSPLSFDYFDYIGGKFDTVNGEWVYNPVLLYSGFYADIQDPLVIGTYTLEVTTEDAVTHSKPIDFDFLIDLPFSSSRTFQINSDSDGNVYWTWDVPKQLLSLAETYNLVVSAGVGSYVNGQLTALIYSQLPVHMGFCFIPYEQHQHMISKGDEIGFFIRARSTKSNARSYSNSIKVTNFSVPLEIAPKKSAVVIPLF